MLKKLWAIMSAVALILVLNCTAYAQTTIDEEQIKDSGISVKYTYISYTSVNLTINSVGKATCSATLSAYSSVDSVYISAYLQYYDDGWYTDYHWTVEDDDSYVAMSKTRYVTSGYQYRLLVYYYAYSGSSSESTSNTDYYTY